MSPDSPTPSRQRKAWRAMAALGCVLGASSMLLTAVKWNGADARAQKAVCAIVSYAERQSANVASRQAGDELLKLADEMRQTGIACPPRDPFPAPAPLR